MELEQQLATALANPDKALLELDRLDCADSLASFIKLGWHVVEPGRPYVHGWHIDALSEHLEAVADNQINRLVINIPPGSMKSLTVGVFFPVWMWGPKGQSHKRFLGMSHAERLSVRDNMRCKRLVTSQWYQDRWPLQLMPDQNAKLKFENVDMGFREALAITSATGSRGDVVIVDDPHSVDGSDSDAKREGVCENFFEGVSNRLNDESGDEQSAIIVVMQRLHERDLSGQILARDLGYEHLMLPMEFEADRKCYTSIGFEDPRKKDGDLLFPERFSKESVERSRRTLGSYAFAGQHQQRPAPREGGMFKVDAFQIVDMPGSERALTVRYWDKAGTDGGGAYTAGVRMSLLEDGTFLIEDVVRGQWSAGKREKIIRDTAAHDGSDVTIWMEQEPGSAGKDVANLSIRQLAGFTARADRVSGKGSKEIRAEPYAAQVEGGNVYMLKADWNDEFIREHGLFPNGTYKDQVDAAAGAFSKLVKGQKKPQLSLGGGKAAAIRL